VKVLIADDQELVRTGFALILGAAPDMEVVGQAADGEQAVHQAQRLKPDVILMDVRMPGVDGIEATRRILTQPDAPKVLMLTTFDLDEHVYDALEAGASGFLLKDVSASGLADAIRTVAAGEALLAPSVTTRMVRALVRRGGRPAPPDGWEELTDREREVFALVARGLSNEEIGGALFLSTPTVKTHVSRLLMKLGVRDRVQLVVLAYRARLVDPD
jgi:DNA-binding NarL/FixJ family response regulator